MSFHMRALWLPGLAAMAGASFLILSALSMAPPELWADPRTSVHVLMAASWLAAYVGFGALAASWSRLAGGDNAMRWSAALMPAALHAAIVVPTIVAGIVAELRAHPGGAHFNPQLIVLFVLVALPALALTAGAMPFFDRRPQHALGR